MNKRNLIFIGVIVILVAVFYKFNYKSFQATNIKQLAQETSKKDLNPLSIEAMRARSYPGSDIAIEQTLSPGSNYNQYIASYKSDGLKIYGLLTVPEGTKPEKGWPVIIFNHGYIPPEQYRTTERYVAYVDAFARNGYIVFKSDYRGNDNSEGKPEGAYYSPAYTVDVLNAVSSIKKYKDANPNIIGMWGHSMGGSIALRAMVVSKDIKAGVIWGGVVASYQDLATNWHRSSATPFVPSQREQASTRPGRQSFINKYGDFNKNPEFWNSISPISYVKDISGPIQLDHGTADQEVPLLFSQRLDEVLKKEGKTVEFYTYQGDDHNISQNLELALQRSVVFFNKYLKSGQIGLKGGEK